MKRLIVDIDNTICFTDPDNKDYSKSVPNTRLISKLLSYKERGYIICLHTSRNMRTYNGNIGEITKNTVPTLISWLEENKIPFDELVVGKPWCGDEGFYIDDRAIRPDEFIKLNELEIKKLFES